MTRREMQYEVDNPEIKARLRAIGESIKKTLPPNFGFALHIFEYGDGGDMFFISSAARADYIRLLREFISRYEEN